MYIYIYIYLLFFIYIYIYIYRLSTGASSERCKVDAKDCVMLTEHFTTLFPEQALTVLCRYCFSFFLTSE